MCKDEDCDIVDTDDDGDDYHENNDDNDQNNYENDDDNDDDYNDNDNNDHDNDDDRDDDYDGKNDNNHDNSDGRDYDDDDDDYDATDKKGKLKSTVGSTNPGLFKWTGVVSVELPDCGSGIQDKHVIGVQALLAQRNLNSQTRC